ncbi:MAG: amidohydrolase family protein [Bacteroidota bacterium]
MENVKKILITVWLLAIGHWSFSQSDVPAPAPKQMQSVYLTHATVHVGDGKVLQNATVGFANGKIILVAENPSFKTDETMGKVIDCTGKHIYPGIIALNTRIGLAEIEAVRSTNDYAEVGSYNTNVRSIISYNTDSRVTPTVRSNGILYAQIVPAGGTISGTSSLVHLDAWNWEDALVTEDGIWLNWPSTITHGRWWEGEASKPNKDYDKQVKNIKDYFSEAKSYLETLLHEKENLRFEAMKDLLAGKKKLFVRVNRAQEILHAIQFAEEFKLQLVVAGGVESWMVADELAQKKIPVILSETHDLPVSDDADIDQPFKTPAQLQKAGVLFSLSIPNGFWQERNLMFMAGTAVAYGLTKEQALSAITSAPAKIVGADAQIGTLENGKAASLIVSTGDVLDMQTSNIEYAFIDGRQINLNNKQKELNSKFMKKYGLN